MLQPNVQIGPYTLLRELGRGASGVVWLAKERTLLRREVALKLPMEEDPDLEAIENEAQNWLRAGNHPNVVAVLNADVYNGQVVIASEYVAGGSLSRWLRQHNSQAPSIEAAIRMLAGILSGLEHLHSLRPEPIIHRDLKPANVMLTEETETPRITDFGVARVLKATHSTNISGTPAYMAPEMFEGRYSTQSDLWAAGIILYRMLSGKLPFDAVNMAQLLRVIERDAPEPLPDSVPLTIQRVVDRALKKDPAQRFASAAEMRSALFMPPSTVQKLQFPSIPLREPEAPIITAEPLMRSVEPPSDSNAVATDHPQIPVVPLEADSDAETTGVLPVSSPPTASVPTLESVSPAPKEPAAENQSSETSMPIPAPSTIPPRPEKSRRISRPPGGFPSYGWLALIILTIGGFAGYKLLSAPFSTKSLPPSDKSILIKPQPVPNQTDDKAALKAQQEREAQEKAHREQSAKAEREAKARQEKEKKDKEQAETWAKQARGLADQATDLIEQSRHTRLTNEQAGSNRKRVQKNSQEALLLCEKALKLDSKNLTAWRTKVAAYLDLGDRKSAKQAAKQANALDTQHDKNYAWIKTLAQE